MVRTSIWVFVSVVVLGLSAAASAQEYEYGACDGLGVCAEENPACEGVSSREEIVACYRTCLEEIPEENKEIVMYLTDCLDFIAIGCEDEECLIERCGFEYISWERCKAAEKDRLCDPETSTACECSDGFTNEPCDPSSDTCLCIGEPGGENNGPVNNGNNAAVNNNANNNTANNGDVNNGNNAANNSAANNSAGNNGENNDENNGSDGDGGGGRSRGCAVQSPASAGGRGLVLALGLVALGLTFWRRRSL